MHFFKPAEFQGHYERLNPKLKEYLDEFRRQWGRPIRISPAPKAVGRTDGNSQHNYMRWGDVRAVDVMPDGLIGRSDAIRAVQLAKDIGFTGIGVYPDWRPSSGMHLDVRDGRERGKPATWGGVRNDSGKQVYVSMEQAINDF